MPAFPEGVGAFVRPVEIVTVRAADLTNHAGDGILVVRRDEEMYMFRHQAIGMDIDTIKLAAFFPRLQIELVVFGLYKSGFAVIAALDNIIWITRQVRPCSSWHNNSFAIELIIRESYQIG